MFILPIGLLGWLITGIFRIGVLHLVQIQLILSGLMSSWFQKVSGMNMLKNYLFAGQNVHVAIKYTSIYLQNLHIDDIQISPGGDVPPLLISEYSDEFDFVEDFW